MKEEAKPFYYHITGYECGITNTGSRSANYQYHLYIYDANINLIESKLSDAFYGRWSKCSTVINRWRKEMEKCGLFVKPL